MKRSYQARLAQKKARFNKQLRRNKLAVPGVHEFVIVLDHLKTNFNIGKIFRSAESFGAHEIHLIGIDYFDPDPGKGTLKHVPVHFHDNFQDCHNALAGRDYHFYRLDPAAEKSLVTAPLPVRSAFVFGHEEFGFSFKQADYPEMTGLVIPQFGKTDSLNVAVAASLVMYEYVRSHATEP
ncbi:MAG: TrmH family RNA methyltransferase [Thermodesulfobacteriota bacterium]